MMEPGHAAPQQLSIGQLLFSPAQYDPRQEIVYRDRRLTYADLRERVQRLAGALTALGVGQGDCVAVLDWDSHRYLECFFGVPMLGAVLQTVNIRLSPAQIRYTLEQTRPRVLLVHPDFGGVLDEVGALDFVPVIVPMPDEDSADACAYENRLAAAAPVFAFPTFPEETTATTFHTTGTTGLPKQVYFSHRQIVLHTLSLIATYATQPGHGRFDRSDVYMPVTPMFHVHAWGIPFMATALGVKQVYPGRYEAARLLALQRREGVTFSHCVPTILKMMLDDPSGGELTGWKIVVGGAVLTRSLAAEAQARGIDIFCGYGMSETCPLLLISHLDPAALGDDDALDVRVMAGRQAILTDVRIVDEAMQDVAIGERGELVARAPWLTRGYRGNEAASAELWRGGYLHTGDIATRNAGGYVRIVDRLKDVIKSGGEWISSVEVEDLLSRHPAVAECAVIGVPDPKWGERPLALVVARTGVACDPAALGAFLGGFVDQGRLPRYAVPDRFEVVAALDRTSVGKIDKK
ncbi:MAG: long-chain-fatty-acid--CoA ligase, partial [Pseudooceanicola sp.]|nr:long-chain-fatty-acid--CoA ligase [Pseudooceanicola sp.]